MAQSLFGMLADKVSPFKDIVLGTLMLVTGLPITSLNTIRIWLDFFIGILTAAGAGDGSFSILIGSAP